MVCENYSHAYFSKEKRFNGGEIVIRGEPLSLPCHPPI